jgi:hypothetical protein
MERRLSRVFVLLAAAGLAAAAERRGEASTLLTFDDTGTTAEQPLYSGYGGLNWQNVETMNINWWVSSGNPTNGYVNGEVSPPIVAWVPANSAMASTATATISSSTPFAFGSADLTSAWNDNLVLKVIGYLDGQIVGTDTVTLNPSAPTLVNFNFADVDTVTLTASGGTRDPVFPSGGSSPPPTPQFVMDNVLIGETGSTPPSSPPPVPEPSGIAIGGLLIAGWWFHQRYLRQKR